jgi:hypothetical protein
VPIPDSEHMPQVLRFGNATTDRAPVLARTRQPGRLKKPPPRRYGRRPPRNAVLYHCCRSGGPLRGSVGDRGLVRRHPADPRHRPGPQPHRTSGGPERECSAHISTPSPCSGTPRGARPPVRDHPLRASTRPGTCRNRLVHRQHAHHVETNPHRRTFYGLSPSSTHQRRNPPSSASMGTRRGIDREVEGCQLRFMVRSRWSLGSGLPCMWGVAGVRDVVLLRGWRRLCLVGQCVDSRGRYHAGIGPHRLDRGDVD